MSLLKFIKENIEQNVSVYDIFAQLTDRKDFK